MTVPTSPSFPAVHALELIEVAQRLGVPAEQLLEGSGLTMEGLSQPEARISLQAGEQLVRRAIALTGAPGIGIMVGLRMRVPAHGYVGFAAMTAPTLRQALELGVRYAPTRTTALGLRLEEGEPTTLFIDEHCDLGGARETVLLALATGLWRIGETLTGKQLVGTAEFAFPTPSFAPPLAGASIHVVYGQPANCLRFARRYLDLPLVMAQPSASRLAQEQCERELSSLDRAGLLERVRSVLPRQGGGVNTVEEVASALGISTRTLHRKLKAEGVIFSEVADALLHRQATALLNDEKLSIEQVAEALGYSDVSNFTRAFKRWTGVTPAAYRRGSSTPAE